MNDRLKTAILWMMRSNDVSSQRSLAVMMGYNPSALSQIINGHVPLSDKFLSRLATVEPRVNSEWIRTGVGEMLLPVKGENNVAPDNENREMEYLTENTRGAKFYTHGDQLYMTVKHVPYAAFGQFANDSDRLDPINEEWGEETYEVDKIVRGHYLSFEVRGDSMDTGSRESFEAGDRILVRELERECWREPIRFKDHPYFVVVFGSSVLLKEMVDHDTATCTLTFHSLNPSPEYADFSVSLNDIRALYYVIKKKPRQRTLGKL